MSGLCHLFTVVPLASGQGWTQSAAPSNEQWQAVACSADGSSVVAAGLSGVYRSTNSGVNWNLTSAPGGQSWSSVASSADGAKLAAGVDGGFIYTSTDGGATWKWGDSPSNSWQGVASSADGNRMVAVCGSDFSTGGGLYTSTNAGANWIISGAPTNGFGWYAVASSADGTKLAAMTVDFLTPGGPSGWIYTSTNAGGTWTRGASMGWPCSLVVSADGRRLVAAKGSFGPLSGLILISTNSGATSVAADLPRRDWSSVGSSADGNLLIAAMAGLSSDPIVGLIYTSTDSGAIWTSEGSPTNNWASVAVSADGAKLVAAASGGGIYTWQTTPGVMMDISLLGTNLLLSWTVPSLSLVLRENRDLATTNWTDVPAPPSLNVTNLHYEVAVALWSGTRYYRLTQR